MVRVDCPPGRVLLFGDSISVQDAPALASLLQRSSGLTTAINAWNMRPTAPAVDELEQWARRYGLPRRIVMRRQQRHPRRRR